MAEGLTPTGGGHGLVLGGGMAGMLAATVLAEHLETVTIVDRDRFAEGPAPRKGVPQARHTHLLLARGARAIDELLPGMSDDLVAAGAHRVALPHDLLMFTPSGWVPRLPGHQFFLSGSRGLVDWRVRERVLNHPRVQLVEGVDVVGLTGGVPRVTGARLRARGTGETSELAADLVVDTTGRGSRAPDWLANLGFPQVRELVVDGGIAYATRLYRAASDEPGRCPPVYIQPDPDGTGQGGALLPIEDDHWIVSLSGMRGGEPPTGEQEFARFAEHLPHRLLADLLGGLEPVSGVHGFRNIANRQRLFERLSPAPTGFLALGDASCVFNPVYGHGMSVAALGAVALRDKLRRSGTAPDLARRTQRAVAWAGFDPWNVVTGQDRRYPHTVGPRRNAADRLIARYVNRVGRTSMVRPAVTRALVDANTMSAPLLRLMGPRVLLHAIRGPGRGWRLDPSAPLTGDERDFLHRAVRAG